MKTNSNRTKKLRRRVLLFFRTSAGLHVFYLAPSAYRVLVVGLSRRRTLPSEEESICKSS